FQGDTGGGVVEGASAVGHGALRAQDGLHAVPPHDAARQVAQEPAEGSDRQGEQGEQEGDLDQVTCVDGSGGQAPHADEEYCEYTEVGQGFHERVEHGAHAADLEALPNLGVLAVLLIGMWRLMRSTASTPRLGRASMNGSNMERMRPTWMSASRRRWAACVKRSVSVSSRPRVLTTSAPSKDS